MVWVWRKLSSKLTKNQPPSPVFLFFLPSLFLSPSQPCLQPPPLSPHAWPLSSPSHFSLSTDYFSLFLHSGSSPLTPPFLFSSFSSIGSNNINTDLHRPHRLENHHLHQPSSLLAAEKPPWPPLSLVKFIKSSKVNNPTLWSFFLL